MNKQLVGFICLWLLSDGNWGSWAAFGSCSVTCGGGTQTHTRLCNNPAPANGGATCPGSASESVSCNTQACNTGTQANWQTQNTLGLKG